MWISFEGVFLLKHIPQGYAYAKRLYGLIDPVPLRFLFLPALSTSDLLESLVSSVRIFLLVLFVSGEYILLCLQEY